MKVFNIFYKPIILVLVFYFLITAFFTFPLILNISSAIPGFISTDEPFAALWNFWWLKFSWKNNLSTCNQLMIAAPFGVKTTASGYPIWEAINRYVTILTNNIFTYNFEIFLSFLLSGLFMFILGKNVTGSSIVGIFCGLIYTFCPYHFARVWQHLGLAQIQWMPLYILTLLNLYEKQNINNALLSSLSFALVMNFDLYYSFFMGILNFLFLIFILNKIRSQFKFVKYLIFSCLTTIVLVLPNILIILSFINKLKIENSSRGVFGYIRPFEDLFSQSARPLSYFLPATTHPIFGKFTESFIGSTLYGLSLTEHSLYLGWTPLILALIAFREWKKNKNLQVASREHFFVGFFIFVAVATWFLSQPPWWKFGPVTIYMPSFFIYKILPMFRAYCRFGIVMMLAVSVLAGFGLKYILEKLKDKKLKTLLTILFSGLVLFEFFTYPPFKLIDVSKVPAVYYWLKVIPGDFTIAEYPLDTNGENVMYLFYQSKHQKKIINGTTPGTYANKVTQSIVKLSEPRTASVLKWMGVRYAIVHRDDYLTTELIEDSAELKKIPANPELKFIKSFPAQQCSNKDIRCSQETGPIDVYEIIAKPSKPEM